MVGENIHRSMLDQYQFKGTNTKAEISASGIQKDKLSKDTFYVHLDKNPKDKNPKSSILIKAKENFQDNRQPDLILEKNKSLEEDTSDLADHSSIISDLLGEYPALPNLEKNNNKENITKKIDYDDNISSNLGIISCTIKEEADSSNKKTKESLSVFRKTTSSEVISNVRVSIVSSEHNDITDNRHFSVETLKSEDYEFIFSSVFSPGNDSINMNDLNQDMIRLCDKAELIQTEPNSNGSLVQGALENYLNLSILSEIDYTISPQGDKFSYNISEFSEKFIHLAPLPLHEAFEVSIKETDFVEKDVSLEITISPKGADVTPVSDSNNLITNTLPYIRNEDKITPKPPSSTLESKVEKKISLDISESSIAKGSNTLNQDNKNESLILAINPSSEQEQESSSHHYDFTSQNDFETKANTFGTNISYVNNTDKNDIGYNLDNRPATKESVIKEFEQISSSIKYAISSDHNKIRINMYPKNLGAVDVTLEFSKDPNGSRVDSIKITTENKDSLRIIEESQSDLLKSLSEVTETKNTSLEFSMKNKKEEESALLYSDSEERDNWMNQFSNNQDKPKNNSKNPDTSGQINNKSIDQISQESADLPHSSLEKKSKILLPGELNIEV